MEKKTFANLQILEKSLIDFYEFYNFERLHGSILNLPPVTFWKQWVMGNTERQVVDAEKQRVHLSLK